MSDGKSTSDGCCPLCLAGHITILILGLLGQIVDGFPKQTLFSGSYLGIYTGITFIIALILLVAAFLSEWYRLVRLLHGPYFQRPMFPLAYTPPARRKHIVPKQDLSSIMQHQINNGSENQRPMWEVGRAIS